MSIVNMKTGERVSNLWLVLIVPVFLVGFFFYVVAALTCMVVGVALLDSSPMVSAGPAPVGIDLLFIYEMLRFDHWLVGLAGFSCPWLAVVPGYTAAAIWEWANGGR
jgi:hypothetical protein